MLCTVYIYKKKKIVDESAKLINYSCPKVWDQNNLFILKEVSYADQACIYLIKNTVQTVIYCEILLQFKITIFCFDIF